MKVYAALPGLASVSPASARMAGLDDVHCSIGKGAPVIHSANANLSPTTGPASQNQQKNRQDTES